MESVNPSSFSSSRIIKEDSQSRMLCNLSGSHGRPNMRRQFTKEESDRFINKMTCVRSIEVALATIVEFFPFMKIDRERRLKHSGMIENQEEYDHLLAGNIMRAQDEEKWYLMMDSYRLFVIEQGEKFFEIHRVQMKTDIRLVTLTGKSPLTLRMS